MTDQIELLSPQEAYEIASQWGSLIRAGDPGAAFYTFKAGDAQPQGERHRAQLLAYNNLLLESETLSADDREELEALKLFFERFPHSGEEFRETYAAQSEEVESGFDLFTKGYAAATVWIGAELPEGHPDADSDKLQDFPVSEIEPDTLRGMADDCARFQADNAADLAEAYARDGYSGNGYTAEEQAGHDFFLTRNGHGTGFWDRDALDAGDLGKRLSAAAKKFGEFNLYTGDDGGIYAM